jgi:hypothetical protein
MSRRRNNVDLPREAIRLTTYAQLELYLSKFAAGELGLVLLIGRHGTGKSEGVKRALHAAERSAANDKAVTACDVLYVEGHMQPYGLYKSLWENRDNPVVLDDLDKLYADANCVRLLKPLCNTERTKRVSWLTRLTLNTDVPPFTTTSSVILIANEWRTVNANVRALEDRAIILHFDPTNDEVHHQADGPSRPSPCSRCVHFSDSSSQAEGQLLKIKSELESNTKLIADFPEVCQPPGRKPGPARWRVDEIVAASGAMITALGVGKMVRGRANRQDRPTLIVVDDPEGDEAAQSAERREKLRDWVNRALLKAGTDRTIECA